MIWRLKSCGALDLTKDYFAFIDDADNPNMQPSVELEVVQLGESAAAEAGMTRKEDYLVVTVIPKGSGKQAKIDALEMAFDSLNSTSQKIIFLDNNKEEWYVMGRVANHAMKAMVSKITLQIADIVFRKVTEKSVTWSITASGQTLDIPIGGTVEALPIFELTTVTGKTAGFGYRNWCRLYNPTDEAVVNELVDITNGGLNTAALVSGSKMQSDGDDARVYEGLEIDRFLYNMNAAATKIFAGPFNFQPKIEMTLDGAMAGAGAITSILVKQTAANKALLNRLPNKRGLLEIDNERFLYTGRDVGSWRIDIALRTVRKSTIAAHSDGATIKWLEHDVWLYYGNSTLAAPTTDPNHQAAFDIATSTNGTKVWTSYGDKAALRPGSWRSAVIKRAGPDSDVYSGNHGDTTANPITDMGMAIRSYLTSGKAKAENAILEWKFSHPGGITSVLPVGEKRRTTTKSWPTLMGLQISNDGQSWATQFNEAAPSVVSTYESITNTGLQTLAAGMKHIKFIANGAIAAGKGYEASLEMDAVTVVITNPIAAALQGEETNYDLDCEIQLVNTGQSLFLKWTMQTPSDILTANSEERTVIHSDGTNAYRAKRLNAARIEWLPFKPNAINQLKFIETGVQGVSLKIRFTERRKR